MFRLLSPFDYLYFTSQTLDFLSKRQSNEILLWVLAADDTPQYFHTNALMGGVDIELYTVQIFIQFNILTGKFHRDIHLETVQNNELHADHKGLQQHVQSYIK
jgi:hypothetical protein